MTGDDSNELSAPRMVGVLTAFDLSLPRIGMGIRPVRQAEESLDRHSQGGSASPSRRPYRDSLHSIQSTRSSKVILDFRSGKGDIGTGKARGFQNSIVQLQTIKAQLYEILIRGFRKRASINSRLCVVNITWIFRRSAARIAFALWRIASGC